MWQLLFALLVVVASCASEQACGKCVQSDWSYGVSLGFEEEAEAMAPFVCRKLRQVQQKLWEQEQQQLLASEAEEGDTDSHSAGTCLVPSAFMENSPFHGHLYALSQAQVHEDSQSSLSGSMQIP